MSAGVETPWRGKYLEIRTQGRWEYAARRGAIHAAVILAVLVPEQEARAVLLVEQYRVPLGCRTIELPAGLVGDRGAAETVEEAATRELEEETGWRPARIETLGVFAASPGMTAETFTLVRATGLTRTGPGGGEEGEGVTVHTVPLSAVAEFVATKRAEGFAIDVKMLLVLAGGMLG